MSPSAPKDTTSHIVRYGNDKQIHYLRSGASSGKLIILVHGWPGCAETWLPLMRHLTSLGNLVFALDCPGYGHSTARKVTSDYALESLVAGLLAVLHSTGRSQATWIGHDWGAGLVWALAAHHPESCAAVANIAVPYAQIELGLEQMRSTINRDIYPADEHPNGPWDYQAFYESNFEDAAAFMDADVAGWTKLNFIRGQPGHVQQPARTAGITKAGGWLGGAKKPPPEDATSLERTVLTEEIWTALREKMLKTGYWPANSWYSNHKVNREYTLQKRANGGVLEMPVLFIDARYDTVCSPSISPALWEPMRTLCKDYVETSVDAGHWAQLEAPKEVNGIIEKWLAEKASSNVAKI